MNPIVSFMLTQYDGVRGSRSVLLEYCATLSEADLLAENPGFGRGGSIRNLLVHTANTYEFWIGRHALGREQEFTPYPSVRTVAEAAALYATIDRDMEDFFARFRAPGAEETLIEITGQGLHCTASRLFTHVITHEFHHKGQILSMSRQLGYVPVDTDIIR